MLSHPAVSQAVAFALPDQRLGEDVGAAVVLRAGARATDLELRRFAAARLADFKVPRTIVFLEAVPKGPTGKPQRIGLAARLGLDQPEAAAPAPPAPPPAGGELERRVAALWSEVLGRDSVGLDETFLEAGGDSILAVRMFARVEEDFGRAPSMAEFFDLLTVRKFSQWLRTSGQRPSDDGAEVNAGPVYAPSPQQLRHIFLEAYEKDGSPSARPLALRLRGALDREALRKSAAWMVARHEPLRTHFVHSETIEAVVGPPGDFAEIPVVDFSAAPERERDERLRNLVRREVSRRFDLSRDILLRLRLVRLAADDHVLVIVMHHIASDGWSNGVLFEELQLAYGAYAAGSIPLLEVIRRPYSEHVRELNESLRSGKLDSQIAFWLRSLEGRNPYVELPADRPRPAFQTFAGGRETASISQELADRVRRLSLEHEATLFMSVAAAFYALLYRYTGMSDLCIGVPFANRPRREDENLIGLFMNPLPLRVAFDGKAAFGDLLQRVKQAAVAAAAHQSVPFEVLVERLRPERDLSRPPVFQVLFQLRNFPNRMASLPGLSVEETSIDPGIAAADLSFEVEETSGGLLLKADYNVSLFNPGTVRRWLGDYRRLLESAAEAPATPVNRLALLSEEERW